MKCGETDEFVNPYVDGELDLERTLEMETHMRDCTRCAAVHAQLVALRSSVRDASLYFRAPAALQGRIRSNLPARPAARRWWVRGGMAAAAATVLVAATAWLATRERGADRERLMASEVTSAHVRSLMADHLRDVKSSDRHAVKPWFDGRLDFAPDVRDFADASFTLEGGRLDYLGGRPVAALVYRHDKHYLNLFVWPAPGQGDEGPVASSAQGYALLHWIQGGMHHWAISDTAPETLRRFSDVVRAAAPPAAGLPHRRRPLSSGEQPAAMPRNKLCKLDRAQQNL